MIVNGFQIYNIQYKTKNCQSHDDKQKCIQTVFIIYIIYSYKKEKDMMYQLIKY